LASLFRTISWRKGTRYTRIIPQKENIKEIRRKIKQITDRRKASQKGIKQIIEELNLNSTKFK
jgi:hypothetical protein